MDEGNTFVTPSKKKKKIDFELCALCQSNSQKDLVKEPKADAIQKLVEISKERIKYHDDDPDVTSFVENIEDLSLEILIGKIKWHDNCRRKNSNKILVDRAKSKYNKKKTPLSKERSTKTTPDSGPSTLQSPECPRYTRSQDLFYDKERCIICQKDLKVNLHKVEKKELGVEMLEASKDYPDEGAFFRRMNTIPDPTDVIANDVKYHLYCWVKAKRYHCNKENEQHVNRKASIEELADIEIIQIIQNEIRHPGKILTVSDIETAYKTLLAQNGLNAEEMNANYRKYLKELISINVKGAVFSPSPRRNESDRLCSIETNSGAIDSAVKDSSNSNEHNMLFRAS